MMVHGSIFKSLPAADTMFTDSNAVAGTGYEYQVKTNDTTIVKYAYIYAGKDLPTVHYRGKMISACRQQLCYSVKF